MSADGVDGRWIRGKTAPGTLALQKMSQVARNFLVYKLLYSAIYLAPSRQPGKSRVAAGRARTTIAISTWPATKKSLVYSLANL